jgi:N-acetylglucosamine malate deacetylase 1
MFQITRKTILAVAAHIDDVELGLGGTLNKLVKDNDVYYLGLSFPPLVNEKVIFSEFYQSMKIIGIKESNLIIKNYDPRDLFSSRIEILDLLYKLGKKIKPDLVFIPNSNDIHQSHEVIFSEARRALKFSTILGYELPWNCMQFSMDVFVTLTDEEIKAKTAAINAYKTQKDRLFFSNDIVLDLAKVRGKQIGQEYAECFELIRLIL